jgi:hypothetical protein
LIDGRKSVIARFAPSSISSNSDSKPSASSQIASSFAAMLSGAPFTSVCAIACNRNTSAQAIGVADATAPFIERIDQLEQFVGIEILL